jgi:hypothetical protein
VADTGQILEQSIEETTHFGCYFKQSSDISRQDNAGVGHTVDTTIPRAVSVVQSSLGLETTAPSSTTGSGL